jgi:hypothetical protein
VDGYYLVVGPFFGDNFFPKTIYFLKYLDHQISKLPNFTLGSKKLPTIKLGA